MWHAAQSMRMLEARVRPAERAPVEQATNPLAEKPEKRLPAPDACLNGFLIAFLERLACGLVIMDEQRRASFVSLNAQTILDREDRAFGLGSDRNCSALGSLLGRAKVRLAPGLLFWVAVSHKWAIAQAIGETSKLAGENASAVIFVDLDSCAQPSPLTLQQLFGLTLAEGSLAIGMVQGFAPDEIAANRSVSRTTIRSQLASVFAKTQTRRQAELVARLGRLALVP